MHLGPVVFIYGDDDIASVVYQIATAAIIREHRLATPCFLRYVIVSFVPPIGARKSPSVLFANQFIEAMARVRQLLILLLLLVFMSSYLDTPLVTLLLSSNGATGCMGKNACRCECTSLGAECSTMNSKANQGNSLCRIVGTGCQRGTGATVPELTKDFRKATGGPDIGWTSPATRIPSPFASFHNPQSAYTVFHPPRV